ncbi:hypothetical protein I313_02327 [Cryptococcus deuterogattii Ram5]|uniref:Zn(2)-C6 fungal-type domain-containing protein n=1 Tax=Cryptococcus deuterogattii Ram5 TaxID=1296110 RepID=A0A0D0V8N2_9TREE|nr:hypothetical protein I313_02327 [Cryptococcus deuterogattii Ram5]
MYRRRRIQRRRERTNGRRLIGIAKSSWIWDTSFLSLCSYLCLGFLFWPKVGKSQCGITLLVMSAASKEHGKRPRPRGQGAKCEGGNPCPRCKRLSLECSYKDDGRRSNSLQRSFKILKGEVLRLRSILENHGIPYALAAADNPEGLNDIMATNNEEAGMGSRKATSLPNSMASCSICGSDITMATLYTLINTLSEMAVPREYHHILILVFYTSQSLLRHHTFLPTRACAPTPMTLLHPGLDS